MKTATILSAILLFCSSTSNAQMSDRDFESILSSTQSRLKRTNYELNIQSFKPIEYLRQIETSTWEVGLQSWAPMENVDDKVFVLKGKAIIKNLGDHFEFYSVTQQVIPYLLPDIQQEKYVVAGQKWLIKELKFSQVRFGTENSRLTMIANGEFSSQKQTTIANDLAALIQVSRGMLNTVTFAQRKIKKKKLKEFQGGGVSEMPVNWFPHVVEDNSLWDFLGEGDEKSREFWTFSDNDRGVDFYIYNYQNEMVYFLTRTIDQQIGSENREQLLKKMATFANKTPVKGASETKAVLDDDQYYGVMVTLKYDGTIKGATFSKIYWDLWNSYKNKLAKTLDTSLKGT